MTEYRSLASTIRQIILEDYAEGWFKERDITDYKAVNINGKLLGYTYKGTTQKGEGWRYRKPESKYASRYSWNTEEKAKQALIDEYTKETQGKENQGKGTPGKGTPGKENQGKGTPGKGTPKTKPENQETETALQSFIYDENSDHHREAQERFKRDDNTTHADFGTPTVNKNGKDKTLSIPTESARKFLFKSTGITDNDFYSKKGYYTLPEEERFKFSEELIGKLSGKIAASHLNAIERILNTSFKKDVTETWKLFSEITPGDGTVPSRCGELITMAVLALNNEDALSLYGQLVQHVENTTKNNKKYTPILKTDWFDSALEQKNIILKHIQRNFIGKDKNKTFVIDQTSWDNAEDVEALGFNYENKGHSTDIFLRVHITENEGEKNEKKEAHLHEVSLKKDLNTNFFNTSLTGTFEYWADAAENPEIEVPSKFNQRIFTKKVKDAKKLSREADLRVYDQEQKERLSKFFINEFNHPEFKEFLSFKSKKNSSRAEAIKQEVLRIVTKRFQSKREAKKPAIRAGHSSMSKKERKYLWELKEELKKYYYERENMSRHNQDYSEKIRKSNLGPEEKKKLEDDYRRRYTDHSDIYEPYKDGMDFRGHEVFEEHGIYVERKGVGDRFDIIHSKKEDKETVLTPSQRMEIFENEHSKAYTQFVENCFREIKENPAIYHGLNNFAQQVLPLNSLGTGEEQMAIGKHSLDPDVMKSKHLFGKVTDVTNINSYLKVIKHEDENSRPYIAYVSRNNQRQLPIAGIILREDGVGYGGNLKFEFKIHNDFGAQIKRASEQVYGK